LGSFTTRDEQEVAGYAEVMETIFSAYESISFTENHIRQLHRDLLAHSIKDERHRGAYKTLSNNVEAFNEHGESLGIVFETASPFDTPRRMGELIAWADEQSRERRLHPLLVVAIFVVVFLEVHPFQDGNGRLSRVLTTLLLLRAGYAYVPYSSLESIIEQSKESYYISLRRTQVTIRSAEPDWNPWIEFFLRALHRQKTRLENKMERERIILADMPELSVTLLELAREHGRITVSEAARITDASRHTIKDHLKALVDQGHLVLHGAGRGAWYGLS
jgi:Fic family protein